MARPRIRQLLLLIGTAWPVLAGGCAIVEVGVRNPVAGLETVAVVPFFNLSQERTVDGREFALAYYTELQKVPGFEVVPVGVAERAMVENRLSISGPEDALTLAEILDVDAVVVGAVTDYDPYNPRLGLKVAWYSPRQWLFLANEPPPRELFDHPYAEPDTSPRRPKYTMSRAQSPDDLDGTAGFQTIEEGDWEAISSAASPERQLSVERSTGQAGTEPFLIPINESHETVVENDGFESVEWTEARNRVTEAQNRVTETRNRVTDASNPSLETGVGRPEIVSTQATETREATQPGLPGKFLPPVRTQPVDPVPAPPPRTNIADARADSAGRASDPVSGSGSSGTANSGGTPSSLPAVPALPGGLMPGGEGSRAGSSPAVEPDDARSSPAVEPGDAGSSARFARDNPFDPGRRTGSSASPRELDRLVPEINESSRAPGSADEPPQVSQTPTELGPAPPDPPLNSDSTPPSEGNRSDDGGPAVTTPLFPGPSANAAPDGPRSPRSTVPGLVYDHQAVVAREEFDPAEPLMAYVRIFDSTDRRLIARLSDYLELTGQMRSGDLQAYMKRSEFFRKFTAHVMISEMLRLHGGEARRQLILKSRKYR